MVTIHDISLPIGPDLLTWPGDPGIEVVPSSRRSRGDPANVSEFRLGSHSGTHVDPPWHFVDGSATVDRLDLGTFYGEAVVVDVGEFAGKVGPPELEAADIPAGIERVLIRSTNSRLWTGGPIPFPDAYVSVGVDGARWLIDRGVRLVGVDFLSVEADGPPDFSVHRTLLGAGVIVLEGLALAEVRPGTYTLACFPLRVVDGDGAPCRAVLIEP